MADVVKPIFKTNRIVWVSHDEKGLEILKKAGIECFSFPSLIKENTIYSNPALTAREVALKLSEKKAADVGNIYTDLYTISAQQAIECNGKVLKQPECIEDVLNDFKTLNGQKYTLYTAITVYRKLKKVWQDIKSIQLTRKYMTDKQIHYFVVKNGPSMLGVLGSVRLDEFPDIVEEKKLDFDLISGIPVKDITHFFKSLRK